MIGRNDPCWCGSGKKWKKCHYPEESRKKDMKSSHQLSLKDLYKQKHKILLKDDKEIEGIRIACRLSSQILDEICKFAKVGVTTSELNDLSDRLHKEAGAIPAALHYGSPPFP